MKRLLRFTRPEDLENNAAYKTILKYAGEHETDQLRSEKSAARSLFYSVSRSRFAKQFFWRFERCLNEEGYDDAIGFFCGRHMDSAACNYCRFIARVRVMELFVGRPVFLDNCVLLTIIDSENDVPVGNLPSYDLEDFRQRLNSVRRRVQQQIKFIGQFELQVVTREGDAPTRDWSPHIHIIVNGEGTQNFVDQCRKAFRSSRFAAKPVKQQFLRSRRDVLNVGTYLLKSSTARRPGCLILTSDEKLELNEFLLEKSCSDLLVMHGVNFRNSRVELSSERDLKILNAVRGVHTYFEEQYDRRIGPSVNYELRRQLFDSRGELLLDKLEEHIQEITEQLLDD